jgi:hypothetical protein
VKYESQFGIGEIVTTKQLVRGDKIMHDEIGEVTVVQFDKATVTVFVRMANGNGIHPFRECDLIGDPDFDQEAGKYPEGGEA